MTDEADDLIAAQARITELEAELKTANQATMDALQRAGEQIGERERLVRCLVAGFEAWLHMHTEQGR